MRNVVLFRKRMMAMLLSVAVGAGAFAGSADAARMETLQEYQMVRRAGDTQSTGIHVETPSQEEIRVRAAAVKEINPVYTEIPVTTAPYSAGALSGETLQNAVDTVNLVRFIAGIPSDVTLNAEYGKLAQAASLVNFANDTISHFPKKPDNMDDSLYQMGKEGAGSCNLGCGWGSGNFYANGRPFYDEIIHGWMNDGSAGNIDRVGHRRWVINPGMKQTGFGMVWGKQKGRNSFQDAMYAFDNAFEETEYYGVAWPAQNMPAEFFGEDYPWSISMGTKVANDVVVTLKRKNDGKSWIFQTGSTDFYIENSNYGKPGCIIFRPSDAGEYKAGDSFDVSITGTGLEVKYTVNFFSLTGETPVAAPTATPMAEPAATPTEEPTATPTAEPTATPTPEPVATPTAEPTASPMATPTEEPTASPKSDTVTKLKKVTVKTAKNKKGKKIRLSWGKVTNAAGYQVQYATNKMFTSVRKTKKTGKTTLTLTGLKKKTYYIRIRAYKEAGSSKPGTWIYGAWSTIKKVNVKK